MFLMFVLAFNALLAHSEGIVLNIIKEDLDIMTCIILIWVTIQMLVFFHHHYIANNSGVVSCLLFFFFLIENKRLVVYVLR